MDAKEDIKQRLSIEDVVAEYVQLKRAGRNFKGLSPFSNEKTPSFIVSPEKQIWHDFSSGKGGDTFSFVMEMEGLDFKGALELLARKAGVDLSKYNSGGQTGSGKLKERLFAANELAVKFYQVQFSKNQKALEYIFKLRGFNKETALKFRLGYSPNNGAALVDFLKKKGFNDSEIKGGGLSARSYRGAGDMFRGRIMIPLMDASGRSIGFTARLLEDDPDAPKYINTPQTILYDKSRHVYGLHLAKEAIRKGGYAVLVEGNLDVIASHQAGVSACVATAGTALTQSHLKTLSRLASDVRLCFDADQAGLSATERAIPIASKVGVNLSIITLPGGKDPDELTRHDPGLWQKAIDNKQYALDWLIERYQHLLDLSSAQGKREFSDILLGVVGRLEDNVEQDHYLNRLAEIAGVHADALRAKLRKGLEAPRRPLKRGAARPASAPNRSQVDLINTQHKLLAICLLSPELRPYLGPLAADMFAEEPAAALLDYLRAHPDAPPSLTQAPLLQPLTDYVKILSLQFEELYTGLEPLELRYEAARLQARVIEQYVRSQKSQLAAAMRISDEATMPDLLERAKKLDLLLRKSEGAKTSGR